MELITAKQMQEIDGRTIHGTGIPGRVLMESAGRGCVSALYRLLGGSPLARAVVVAGRGNNGGDGFVIARYLVGRGVDTFVFVVGGTAGISGEALENFSLLKPLGATVVPVEDPRGILLLKEALSLCQVVVDALFGTGLQREVTGLYGEAVAAVNDAGRPTLAVDIPSGVCADTGRVLGCAVRANATATFCRPKPGHFLFPGRAYAGELSVVDIGIPEGEVARAKSTLGLITRGEVVQALVPLRPDGHKGTRGHLAIIAGSMGKSGAAILCAQAAVVSGAGLVTTVLPSAINVAFESRCLEAMSVPLAEDIDGTFHSGCAGAIAPLLRGKDAVAVGPGLGTSKGALAVLTALIEATEAPMVLDADALNLLAENPGLIAKIKGDVVVTPHPGELSRLMGISIAEIQADRVAAAISYAVATGFHVVLKGAGTVVAHPDGTCRINPTGNVLLSTGGSGDLLTGLMGALLAQGHACQCAAEVGVYLHGEVANRLMEKGFETGISPSRVVALLPDVLSEAIRGGLKTRAPEMWQM